MTLWVHVQSVLRLHSLLHCTLMQSVQSHADRPRTEWRSCLELQMQHAAHGVIIGRGALLIVM